MYLLQVNGLVKRNNDRTAINEVSFEMMRHQNIAIAGETGSGKTSLLKMIGGLMQPDAGEILFEGKRVEGPLEKLIPGHDSIAYLSQHFELRNNYRVYELLDMSNKFSQTEATQIFSVCQVEHLLKRRTNELSGGEKQRIVLAMQLIKKPKLLLLDEPFSNLDAIHEQTIKEVIHDMIEHFDISCIMVSHDGKDVLSWADMILVIKNGEIVQQASPQNIYHQPINTYCAGLFGAFNVINRQHQHIFLKSDEVRQDLLMIRPEQLQLTLQAENAIPVTVEKILFEGAHYSIMVRHNNLQLQAHTQLLLNVGQELFIKPLLSSPHFLKSDN